MGYNLYRIIHFTWAYHLTHIDPRISGKSLFMRDDACFIVVIHFCIIQNRSQVNSTSQSVNNGENTNANITAILTRILHRRNRASRVDMKL